MSARDEVLEEVRTVGPATVTQIAAGTGLSESTVRRALQALERVGRVESDDYHRRSRVYLAAEEES